MKRVIFCFVAVVATAVTMPAHAREYQVSVDDDFFARSFIVIRAGDTVTWRHVGESEHTVTAFPDAPKRFTSSQRECVPGANPLIGNDPDDCMDPGDTFSYRFAQPGSYDYYCKVHGSTAQRPDGDAAAADQPCGMCGRVVVKAASTPPPTTGSRDPDPPRETEDASPSPSASESPSPTASASPSPDEGEEVAVGSDDGSGGLGRGTIALLGIMVLSGAGWWIWRRYLASA